MKIDPEFKALIPPSTESEQDQLSANLRTDGCRDPLVVWAEEGLLLDGHTRYAICQQYDVPFTTVDISLVDRSAAIEWIIRNQFGRRNLAPFQRAELALRLEGAIAARAKENQQVRKGEQAGTEDNSTNIGRVDTQTELAKSAGVSKGTIHKAKVIAEQADEETKAKLRTGETTISHEYEALRKPHVAHNSGVNEWYTPTEYIEAARSAMGSIDCDPASCEKANETVQAKVFYTIEDNGLTQPWQGNVWLNPPYSKDAIVDFAAALILKQNQYSQACILVNNATETAWFQDLLTVAAAVCFPRKRIAFLDPEGNPGQPLQGQAILYIGEDRGLFNESFAPFGTVAYVQ